MSKILNAGGSGNNAERSALQRLTLPCVGPQNFFLQDGVERNFARQYQEFEEGKFSESATQFISSSWQGEALRSSQVCRKRPLLLSELFSATLLLKSHGILYP